MLACKHASIRPFTPPPPPSTHTQPRPPAPRDLPTRPSPCLHLCASACVRACSARTGRRRMTGRWRILCCGRAEANGTQTNTLARGMGCMHTGNERRTRSQRTNERTNEATIASKGATPERLYKMRHAAQRMQRATIPRGWRVASCPGGAECGAQHAASSHATMQMRARPHARTRAQPRGSRRQQPDFTKKQIRSSTHDRKKSTGFR